MSAAPLPVVFEPLYVRKPWGGRRLAALLNKSLPPNQPIGESWELVSLPGHESRVRGGVLAGWTLAALVDAWASDLLGGVARVEGRFPLLIKFLDARENLSVQVHPKPGSGARGVKHEAWYIVQADPGAKLYVGLKPGVRPEDVKRVVNTPALIDLLREWPAEPGGCYYLPSGTPHALGAGIVVAEIQTPSDVTYRMYDWGRVDADGRPRELHVAEALANVRYDVTKEMVRPSAATIQTATTPPIAATRVATCERFVIDHVTVRVGDRFVLAGGRMRVWIILDGAGRLTCEDEPAGECRFACGDVVLIPAACTSRVEPTAEIRLLEVSAAPSGS